MSLKVDYTNDAEDADLAFRLIIGRRLTDDEARRLGQLVEAWYNIGLYGGYGGYMHDISELSFQVSQTSNSVEWMVDFGSVEEMAIDILKKVLEEYGKAIDLSLDRLVIGWPDEQTE